ncbi:MAG: PIN domain-containing protein [Candidatus Woesearchaeota archaeon]
MKLVADANILFSLVKKGSSTQYLVDNFNLQLISVDFVLDELYNHKIELLKKSKLNSFDDVKKILDHYVIFVDAKSIKKELKEVAKLISDENDIIYLALAKKYDLVVWSNDNHFKKQSLIKILTTADLVKLLY